MVNLLFPSDDDSVPVCIPWRPHDRSDPVFLHTTSASEIKRKVRSTQNEHHDLQVLTMFLQWITCFDLLYILRDVQKKKKKEIGHVH